LTEFFFTYARRVKL